MLINSDNSPKNAETTQDWSKLLEKFNDDPLEEITLALAFTNDRALIAITMDTSTGREVLLVDSHLKLHQITEKVRQVDDLWLVRDDPQEYAQLVKQGWSKAGIQRFIDSKDPPARIECTSSLGRPWGVS